MELNTNQRDAIHTKGHSIVVACPGSGKTRVLVERAAILAKENPTDHIVVVTFTRQAAGELRRRLEEKVASLAYLRVATFHSLALQQLLAISNTTICGPSQQLALMRRAASRWLPESKFVEFRQAVDAHTSGALSALNNSDFQKTYDEYLELLAEHAATDFGQGVLMAAEGMETGALAPLLCDHLLVDEVQDIDKTQIRWIRAHTTRGATLTVVGDDDQSVYAFRNAQGHAGMQHLQQAHQASLVTLSVNYRSHSEILGMAKKLIDKNIRRLPKDLVSAKGVGGAVLFHQYFWTDEEEADALAVHSAKATEPMAIIARSNYKLDLIAASLKRHKVEFSRPGRSGFWEAEEPALFVALLESNSLSDPLTLSAVATRAGSPSPKAFKRTTAFSELQRCLADNPFGGNPGSRIRGLSGWLAANMMGIPKKRREPSLMILDLCRKYLEDMEGSCAFRIQSALRPKSTKESRITLLTMHGAKGLEFPCVWIAGVQDGTVPSRRSDDIEEERRLFYVAMTRAEKTLFLSFAWNQVITRQETTFLRKMAPSQFLTIDLGLPVVSRHDAHARANPGYLI